MDRFVAQAREMVGSELCSYYSLTLAYLSACWRYISPLMSVALIISSVEVFATTNYDSLVCRTSDDDDDDFDDSSSDCNQAQYGYSHLLESGSYTNMIGGVYGSVRVCPCLLSS